MKICNNEICTGCGMCANLCAKNAISMQSDKHGFFYPLIDEAKCVKCNLCFVKCPSNNNIDNKNNVCAVYAAWNKDTKIRKRSSSGGIFSLIANLVLHECGIVAGVRWDQNFHTYHCCINNKEDLFLLNGSKYVQSFTGNIYSTLKNHLINGKKVLFSGTPCQVHALRQYLGKSYENLYTIDLICHGVPSSDIFDRYLYELTDGQVKNIKSVSFRYKKPCWSYSSVRIEILGKPLYIKTTVEDPFFNLFNFNYSLRPSCHICQYTHLNRQGDLTLSDFWGYTPSSFKMHNYDKGVSSILVNTDKGAYMIDAIKSEMLYEESSIDSVKRANRSLVEPFPAPADINEFWKDYETGMSVSQLNTKYIRNPYHLPELLWLRRIKNQYRWLFKTMI